MLNKRYQNDNKPVVPLRTPQKEMKKRVDEKVEKGIYKFEKVDCCICNGNDFEILSYKDRFGLYSPVVICKKCGLVQTNPRMTKESYDLFYNSEYVQLDRLYSYSGVERTPNEIFKTQYRRGAKIGAFLKESGVLKKPLEKLFVLEVGCSFGGILKYFRDQGCRIKGVDLEEEQIIYGREKYGLNLSNGTISDVKIDGQPDLIIYSHIFEHLLKPDEELMKIKQVIKPDGALCLLVPDIGILKDGYTLLDVLRIAHTYHFTLRTLTNLLNKNGWELIAGHDGSKALFRIGSGNKSPEIINDYESIMNFLHKVEKWRLINRFLWYLKYSPRLVIVKFLKLFGLYKITKKAIENRK